MFGILKRYLDRHRTRAEHRRLAEAASRLSATAHLPVKARQAAIHAQLAKELGRAWP